MVPKEFSLRSSSPVRVQVSQESSERKTSEGNFRFPSFIIRRHLATAKWRPKLFTTVGSNNRSLQHFWTPLYNGNQFYEQVEGDGQGREQKKSKMG